MSIMPPRFSLVPLVAAATAVLVLLTASATRAGDQHIRMVTLSPDKGATISGDIRWEVQAVDGTPSRVDFQTDGEPVRWSEHVVPFVFNGDAGTFDTRVLSNGQHTLTATTSSSNGKSSETSVTVTVANPDAAPPPQAPPPVTLSVATTIVDGATLSGTAVWAAQPSAAVSEVNFLIDGVKQWVERATPYQYNGDSGVLDTTTLANGSHTLTATAIAADGTAASATRSVTVQNAAPSQSSLPGSVYFTGDWETGNISPWTWGAQCDNYGLSSGGSLHFVSDVVGQGSTAGRFDLSASSQSNSCEVLRKRTLNLGADEYYGMMFRLPTNWQEPSPAGWGLVLAQLNFQNIWGAPVMIRAHAKHVSLVVQTGYCSDVYSAKPGCRYSSGVGGNVPQMQAVPSVSPGAWHELVIHVRWADDASGIVEVWHRLKGESGWTKTVSLSGYPTVQWSEDQPVNTNGPTSDKFGAYRGAANFPLSVWQDGAVIGTSFDAVSSRLP